MERNHEKKKRYVTLHFAVDVETKEVVAMEASMDDVHDVKTFRDSLKSRGEEADRPLTGRRGLRLGYDVRGVGGAGDRDGDQAHNNRAPGPRLSARGRAMREFLKLGHED